MSASWVAEQRAGEQFIVRALSASKSVEAHDEEGAYRAGTSRFNSSIQFSTTVIWLMTSGGRARGWSSRNR